MEPKNKFVIEFDKPPAFIYVAEGVDNEHVYIEGNKIKGWKSLELKTDMENLPEYKLMAHPVKEIEFKDIN